jgi:hypothetical protein
MAGLGKSSPTPFPWSSVTVMAGDCIADGGALETVELAGDAMGGGIGLESVERGLGRQAFSFPSYFRSGWMDGWMDGWLIRLGWIILWGTDFFSFRVPPSVEAVCSRLPGI